MGESTWEDMVRLQNEGVYPTAFEAIKSPVLNVCTAPTIRIPE